jgi:hypothetical protein
MSESFIVTFPRLRRRLLSASAAVVIAAIGARAC